MCDSLIDGDAFRTFNIPGNLNRVFELLVVTLYVFRHALASYCFRIPKVLSYRSQHEEMFGVDIRYTKLTLSAVLGTKIRLFKEWYDTPTCPSSAKIIDRKGTFIIL